MKSTMKAAYLSLLFACLFLPCIGQAPKLSVVVGGGILRPFAPAEDDPYAGYVYHRHGAALSFGCGKDFKLGTTTYFAPEVGYEIYWYNYGYGGRSAGSLAKLLAGSVRLAPAVKVWIGDRIFVRVGVNGLISAGAFGKYVVEWPENGLGTQRATYTNHFERVRRLINVGPELAVGYQITLRNGKKLNTRLAAFVGVIPPFETLPQKPANLYMARINIEINYPLVRRN